MHISFHIAAPLAFVVLASCGQSPSDLSSRAAGAPLSFAAQPAQMDAQTTALNGKLRDIEQTLLSPSGLPFRPWFRNILYAPGRFTGYGSKTLPGLREAVEERRFDDATREAGIAAKQLGEVAGTTNGLLNEEGRPLIGDLRKTIRSAEQSMTALDATLAEARPGIKTFSTQTLPEIGQLVRDLQTMSETLSSVANKIDQQGAGALIGAPSLPEYKGDKDGK